jgi:hypothetical protein
MLPQIYWNRILSLAGRRPRLGTQGYAQIYGRKLDGGYYYLTSPDLPGFRATLPPEQLDDLGTLAHAIEPALGAYLNAYLRAQKAEDKRIRAHIYEARLPRHGRAMNLVAEFCAP